MSETKKLSDEQIAALRAPLPPEAVKPHPTKTFLSTIKAIYVVERLNEVFGLDGWGVANRHVVSRLVPRFKDGQKVSESEMVVIHATFKAPAYGIYVESFGGNDNDDLGDAYKGACTDALTKIGSYLYIGMDVFKGLADHAPQGKREASKPLPAFAAPKKAASASAKRDPKPFPDGGDVLEMTVKAISVKANAKGKAYGFLNAETEKWMNTFDKHVGEAVEKGKTYRFVTVQNGDYTNIVGFEDDFYLPPEPDGTEITDADAPWPTDENVPF